MAQDPSKAGGKSDPSQSKDKDGDQPNVVESTEILHDDPDSMLRSPSTRDGAPHPLRLGQEVEELPGHMPVDDDLDWMSDASLSEESDNDDCPLDMRLQQPTLYFQELDTLESAVFNNSAFQFYTDGSTYEPFTGKSHLKIGYGGNPNLRRLAKEDVERFHHEVVEAANEAVGSITSASDHYVAKPAMDRAIQNLFHFVECRNIILWVMESIEAMERASYCRSIISILVIDKLGHDVARLVPIQCSKIRELATAFETCLEQLLGFDRLTPLVDRDTTFANSVSETCREFLNDLQLNMPAKTPVAELWRYVVHILDVAVLSYAGAHTQFFGPSEVRLLTLPGPFLEKQCFVFRRRSFSCLGEFLGGKEAWVLEWYRADAPQVNLPPLYLSTNAATFGDIWGPMWKTCALINGEADHNQILQYSVGNGAIIPWKHPDDKIQAPFGEGKGQVFCHWMSDLDIKELENLADSTQEPLQPDDILLIGAPLRLRYNPGCTMSTAESVQRLRESGSLSELGTMKNSRVVDSNTVQIQVGPPYVKGGAQRTYKRRGCTWKEAWTEDWKNNPGSRNVRILEHKFGVEVSACTFNARRRRLITLLGSNTMVNYLRNGSLTWTNDDCRKEFYNALMSDNHRAFRKLYTSHTDWQSDLGQAITLCIDVLKETGTKEKGLDLLWVPDSDPGRRVSISLSEHRWIGFLKDNEDICTMGILENKGLELPDLPEARGCRNRQQGNSNPSTPSSSDTTSRISVLETAFTLNENAIPRGVRPTPCRGPHGGVSVHKHLWSTSKIEPGWRFDFGGNGTLCSVRPLGNGQILSTWTSSSKIISGIQRLFSSHGEQRKHQEYIREEKRAPGPINVLILGSKSESDHTTVTTAASKAHRAYSWVPARNARPRTVLVTGEWSLIMDRFVRGELLTDRGGTGLRESTARLVADLLSTYENLANRGMLDNGNRRNEGGGGEMSQ